MRITSARPARTSLDEAVFDDLYERQFGRLVSALQLAGAGQGDAEDIAQEAFVRVLARWRSIADPAAYLFRTAFRLHGRHRRRTSRGRSMEEASLREGLSTVEDMVLRRRAVDEALARLTRRQRECAVLYFFIGFSTDEVADLLRVRPATVRVHLHDARRALSPETQPAASGPMLEERDCVDAETLLPGDAPLERVQQDRSS
jgi:RNA polymerase sigma factor (sigma-70 family)